MFQPRYKDLRGYILKHKIFKIINLGEHVFDQATVPVCISIIQNNLPTNEYLFSDRSSNGSYIGNVNDLIFDKITSTHSDDLMIIKKQLSKSGELFLEDVIELKDAGINYQRVNVGLSDKGNSDLSDRLLYEGEKEGNNDMEYWKGADIDKYFIASHTERYVKKDIPLNKNEILSNGISLLMFRMNSSLVVGFCPLRSVTFVFVISFPGVLPRKYSKRK